MRIVRYYPKLIENKVYRKYDPRSFFFFWRRRFISFEQIKNYHSNVWIQISIWSRRLRIHSIRPKINFSVHSIKNQYNKCLWNSFFLFSIRKGNSSRMPQRCATFMGFSFLQFLMMMRWGKEISSYLTRCLWPPPIWCPSPDWMI